MSRVASFGRRWLSLPIRSATLCAAGWAVFFGLFAGAGAFAIRGQAQAAVSRPALGDVTAARARAQRFLAGRGSAAARTSVIRTEPEVARVPGQAATAARVLPVRPQGATADLTASWRPLGPGVVNSAAYGPVTGRITSVALDPNDATGNTVWLGTTGGGVWKSSNAAGPLGSVTFVPLTDTLPVFSANEGAVAVPSLSIGAVSVQPAPAAVVLAGTGDPNDATDSYYGEGILRSSDGGQTWSLAGYAEDGANGEHLFAGLATSGFAWSFTAPSLVVAAMSLTDAAGVVGAAGPVSVPGLYFSTDAGGTWHMASVYDGTQLVQAPRGAGSVQAGNSATAVVWDAARGMFVAALSGHGYYGSADGQTWIRLAHQPGTGLSTTNCPAGANGVASPNCPILRGALAVQPVTGDLYALTVDAGDNDQGLWQDLCNANSAGMCATAAPVFAARLDGGALEAGEGATGGSSMIPQGSYDLTLLAVQASSGGTELLAGAVDLYRCALGAGSSACVWRNTTNAGDGCNAPARVAPAQHALAALPQSEGALLFLGNDGGLWRSPDGVAETGAVCSADDASHFENLNTAIGKGGSLAEVVGFAQPPGDSKTLLAGLGAEGSAATTSAYAATAWPQMSEGEGGFPQIDPAMSSNWYVELGAGVNLKLCDAGADCGADSFAFPPTVGEPQVENDAALLDAPSLLDPQDTEALVLGTCRVWRGPAQSGSGWSETNALSPALDGSAGPCSSSSALIRSLAAGGPLASGADAAHRGSAVLYAGMAGAADGGGAVGGQVFVTEAADTGNGSTAWTDTALSPVTNSSAAFNANGFDISSVTADPHDASGATVYATIMGFGREGANSPHVYRSVDFGGHWTDISANLPDAPANSLVVDPNDANTVYVATDAGVFVSQTVSTCAFDNCWSPLGTGLPGAPVVQLQAGAKLPAGDGRVGMLRAATYGRGLWETPLLTAAVPTEASLAASPASLTFAPQPEGSMSPAQAITLTSSGNSPVSIGVLAVTGDFVETDTCSGQTLSVGASCSIAVRFAPETKGAQSGLLTVYANVSGGQVTVTLSGSATTAAAIVLTPLSLTFPATIVNQTAGAEIVTVGNTGGSSATLGGVEVTGDFSIVQSTCGAALSAQTSCSVAVAFTPSSSGARTGTLTVSDGDGTQTAQLGGTGRSPATDTLSPEALTFAQQQVGSTSPVQQVVLTNAGDVPLTLIAASTSGSFTAANGCGSSLAPHSACAIDVAFVPTAVGASTGLLTVTDEVRSQTVTLAGTGVAPPGVSLTPAVLDFGAMGVGLSSTVRTLTLTNNGGLPLTVASSSVTGDFTMAASTCEASLAPGQACQFTLLFAPSTAGARSGLLVLRDNAPSPAQTVTLSGTGIDFGLAANGASSASIASGGSATFPLVLTSVAGLSGNVALGCAGNPANSVCTVTPSTAPLGGNVLISVVVQTGMSTEAPASKPLGTRRGVETLAGCLPLAWIGLLWRRRARQELRGQSLFCLGGVLLLGLLASLAGCAAPRVVPLAGSGGGGGSAGASPTPSGSYAITVTGVSAGVSHSVALTLVVQ